ncbi:MAG: Na/Pi cotransporter family protein [Slackia sp.]|nr:Na/Pi cotransporter family protein [Slackia sp.]
MDTALTTALGLLGGLAIFIFGMNMMSDNLQKVAGEKMKSILSLLTKNPLLGVLAGALTTAVLQSSSATTVMAIGFVSARLMGLPQAISIILGANIGTTITAQIIAFKITDYILAFVFIGFLVSFIAKNERAKSVGLSILGFGLLFLGIETMGDSMKPLAESPVFIDMISQVVDVPILGVAVGTIMTVIVQSSSATIAVLQNLAATPGPDGVASVIGLTGAIPVLLGDNIGTTITALLASIGQSRNAKRVAVSHSLFNISGCLLFIWFIPAFATFVQAISPAGPEIEVISRQIANAHTSFNVAMTLLWLPFIWLMVKIVMRIIPERKAGNASVVDPAEPMYLDDRLTAQPVAALQLVAQEIERCGETIRVSLHDISASLRDKDSKRLDAATAKAAAAGELCQKVTDYLAEMFAAGVLNEDQAAHTMNLMRALNDVERVAALCGHIVKSCKGVKFSDTAVEEAQKAMAIAESMFADAMRALASGDAAVAKGVFAASAGLVDAETCARKAHMKRVAAKECSPAMTAVFNRMLYDIGRVGTSCMNIADLAKADRDVLDYFLIDAEPEQGSTAKA